jgi:hypothetical protein
MIQRSQIAFRLCAFIFAAGLALQALWLLSTEIIRPNVPYFPIGRPAAEAAATQRGTAAVAAAIGVLRGDLWADYVLTLSTDLLADPSAVKPRAAGGSAEDTRNVAITAAQLAPTDARMWLLLALVDQRPDSLGRGTPGPLKMSYYVGPNAVGLIPTRLLIATRSAAISDPELQDLVSREIRTIVTRRPDLRPALFAAYRDAVPEGRRFIESKVGELDRNLSASIRSNVQPQQGAQSPSGSPQQQRGTAGGQPSPDSSQRQ